MVPGRRGKGYCRPGFALISRRRPAVARSLDDLVIALSIDADLAGFGPLRHRDHAASSTPASVGRRRSSRVSRLSPRISCRLKAPRGRSAATSSLAIPSRMGRSARTVKTFRSTSRSMEFDVSTPGRSNSTTKVSPSRHASRGINSRTRHRPEDLLGKAVRGHGTDQYASTSSSPPEIKQTESVMLMSTLIYSGDYRSDIASSLIRSQGLNRKATKTRRTG